MQASSACGLQQKPSMRTRRRRWPWVVLGSIVLVAALLVIAQDQETVRVRSPLSVADPRFVDYVASLVGVPVTEGDAYQVLENGDAIFPSMLDAIDKAQRRISFESFIYSDGEIATPFHGGADRGRTTRRARAHRARLDRVHGPADLYDQGADRRRHSGGLVQSAGVVVDRGSELPDSPQSPRRRWRRCVHRRRRRGRSLARQCTQHGGVARHAVSRDRSGGSCHRGQLLRELARVGRPRGAVAGSARSRHARPARARWSSGAIRCQA